MLAAKTAGAPNVFPGTRGNAKLMELRTT
jgi:hypothetical protein